MKRSLRYFVLSVLVIASINVFPHILVRIFSGSNAVQVFKRSEVTKNFSGTIRVAAYNIAHGRGGKYGSENWTSESEADRELRLIAIAKFLKENDVDVVVLNEK